MAAAIPLVLPAVMKFLSPVIDHFFPDANKAAEFKAQATMLAMQQEGAALQADLQLALGQLEVNKVEAASPSLFVAGWRPAVGWTCALALFCYYVPYTVAATALWVAHCYQTGTLSPRPDLGIADLLGLVGTMLGTATLRTAEKFRGVAAI
jgi:hypothetical protein